MLSVLGMSSVKKLNLQPMKRSNRKGRELRGGDKQQCRRSSLLVKYSGKRKSTIAKGKCMQMIALMPCSDLDSCIRLLQRFSQTQEKVKDG